jgi:alpha/beta superfamily hydrolase
LIRFGGHADTALDLPRCQQRFTVGQARAFAHCFTCSKNFKAVVHISRALARARIGVLRFDFTGLGESEGDFSDTTFSSNVADLVAAAEYMQRELEAPAILIGHSLGGAAVLQAARHIPTCRAVVTIAAPAEPQHVVRHLKSSLDQIQECGSAEVALAGRSFTMTKEFLDDLDRQNMEEVIRTLDRALLIFHSPADVIVGAENAASRSPPLAFGGLAVCRRGYRSLGHPLPRCARGAGATEVCSARSDRRAHGTGPLPH